MADDRITDEEREFLRRYRASQYPRPSVTVDLVIFTVVDADLKVLLITRGEPPFQGLWALPGGFVRVGDAFDDKGESLEAAAHRELSEETGLPEGSAWLEQLGAFGAPQRDPRTRVISVAYYALVRPTLAPMVVAGTDAAEARWWSLTERPALAFDHDAILDGAIARVRERLDRAPLAFQLVPATFTIAELRAVFEAVQGEELDPGNFRRRFLRMVDDGVVEVAPGKRVTPGKPAKVYRFVAR